MGWNVEAFIIPISVFCLALDICISKVCYFASCTCLKKNSAEPPSVIEFEKKETLETLEYVCEKISLDVLAQEQENSILIAFVQGMTTPDGNNDVYLATTKALYNVLDFSYTI